MSGTKKLFNIIRIFLEGEINRDRVCEREVEICRSGSFLNHFIRLLSALEAADHGKTIEII